jgi:hypothetical protein
MEMARFLGRSSKTLKDCWCSFDILSGINNINAAWEEVPVNCLNVAWCRLLPEFAHNFTLFGPVENSDDDVSRLAQEAGLHKVTAEDVTELLNSHGQELSNENMEKLSKELNKQKEEKKEKDEEPPLKYMKRSDLQHIFSAMGTLTGELCDTDHDWE